MKKFYLLIMALVCYVATSTAQSVCPTAFPPTVIHLSIFNANNTEVCTVIVKNMWPNALVILQGPGAAIIPSASGTPVYTDGTGYATFVYDCSQSPQLVTTCVPAGCCTGLVPAKTILPVKLTAFTGRLETESSVRLDFTSALELNSYQYIVERSADGKTFTNVGTVKAAGNSGYEVKYNFIDQVPGAGAYFYRLKMIDIDGSSEYSKVVYVNSKKGAGIVTKLFPNPFNSEVQLIGATSADLNTPGNIRVFNMSGQQIGFRVVGANAIAIDPSAAKGMYFLKFRNSTNTSEQIFKLVKQ